MSWEASILLDKLARTGAVDASEMHEGSPLRRLLDDVGVRIEQLEELVRKREGQLRDALDAVKERDEMIQELQQMVSRAHEEAAE